MMNVSTSSMMARRVVSSVMRSPSTRRTIPLAYFSTDKTVHLVVNAVGVDRPGIVSDFSKHVTDAGGNVGQSKASIMGGHLFSVMMLVQVPASKHRSLEEKLHSIEGMNTSVFETEPMVDKVAPQVGYTGRFTLSGADHPGIVHKVTSLLASFGGNIDTIETAEEPAPHGGTTLFLMEGIVTAPAPLSKDFDAKKIRAKLEELGDDLNCDIGLEDVHDAADTAVFSSM